MAVKCRDHICRRILDVVNISLKGSTPELSSLLFVNGPASPEHVGYHIEVKGLQRVLGNNNVPQIVNMRTDSTIRHVTEEVKKNEPCITFHIDKSQYIKSVLSSNHSADHIKKKKNIVVEYSSPNIAKPFHMGHLRSTVVGNYIANIQEQLHNVKRINYLGDWGTQMGYIKIGMDYFNISPDHLLENPLEVLSKAYTYAYNEPNMLPRAKEIFSSLEKGTDAEWNEQWKVIRQITIENLKKTYKLLGITFDEYSFESNYSANNIQETLKLMKHKNLTSQKGSLLTMMIENFEVPIMKSDGTTVYLIRDIAAALDRINKYNCDCIMYVVDKSQMGYLKNLQYSLNKLIDKNIISHIPFGRITGMSTRKGTSVFLSDILEDAVSKVTSQQINSPNTRTTEPEVTQILAVSALMVYILKHRRMRDFQFDWVQALQSTGDTGIKLQYSHCRLKSLEEKSNLSVPKDCEPSVFSETEVLTLISELDRFEDIMNKCQEEMESFYLVKYAFGLCNLTSKCLKILPVKDQPRDIAEQRLLLFNKVRLTLSLSMKLLGIQPLDKM